MAEDIMSDKNDDFKGNGRASGSVGKFVLAEALLIPTAVVGATVAARLLPGSGPIASTAALATVVVGGAIAAVKGWQDANAAIKQHDDLVHERDMYKQIVTQAEHKGLIETQHNVALAHS
jgi:hypothetical protein